MAHGRSERRAGHRAIAANNQAFARKLFECISALKGMEFVF